MEHQGGACPGYYVNREPFLDVIRMHRAEVNNIGKSRQSGEPFMVPQLEALIDASRECWDMALLYGERYGYRNSQTTVLAPTGTIGFMMDCDTTGIEPDLALVKYKKLVGGGMIKIVNNTVPAALFKLGYDNDEVNAIVSYIDATGTIEGAPGIKPEHLAVFDCSFKPAKGTRSIHYMGHIKMMAAAQPFLSGAISKTVNLPHEATVEDVAEAYAESWRQGIKAVAIYRDGSKGTQPLNTSMDAKKEPSALDAVGSRVLAHLAASQAGGRSRREDAGSARRGQGRGEREATAGSGAGIPEGAGRDCHGGGGSGADADTGDESGDRDSTGSAGSECSAARDASPAAGGACVAHAQVLDRRARGLHHRGTVSERPAGRDLHPHGQGRIDGERADGRVCDIGFAGAAARRAAEGAVREVCAHAV